jgi:hypothetical protein
LERAREQAAPVFDEFGWQLVGALTTAMGNDDEALLLWAIPTWQGWADAEKAHGSHDGVIGWRSGVSDVVTGWHRLLLVDSPLSPMKLGRQPSRDDRTDWKD